MAKILVGCDHRGLETCAKILEWCKEHNHEGIDMGPNIDKPVDYPDYAFPLAERVVKSEGEEIGVLVCGWGNGMAIAANKVHGARAALCMDRVQAEYARSHNDANILILSAEATGWGMIKEILHAFTIGKFEGDRHVCRLRKISDYEMGS